MFCAIVGALALGSLQGGFPVAKEAEASLSQSEVRRRLVLPSTTPKRLSLLLEICDAHSPFRYYFPDVRVDRRTAPILLNVADHEPKVVAEAYSRFVNRASRVGIENVGREDVGRALAGVVWSNFGWPGMAVGKDGELRVVKEWPNFRTGIWSTFGVYSATKSLVRRDLTDFREQKLTDSQAEEALRQAFSQASKETLKKFGLELKS